MADVNIPRSNSNSIPVFNSGSIKSSMRPPVDPFVYTQVDDIFKKCSELIGLINARNLPAIVVRVMSIVEESTELLGSDKKVLAVTVIDKIIASAPLSDTDKAIAQAITDKLVPQLIDVICEVAKGKTVINAELEKIGSFCCGSKTKK